MARIFLVAVITVLLNVLVGCNAFDTGKDQPAQTSPPRLATAEPAFIKKTYTYKTVADVHIKADVYRQDNTKLRPIVVWLHGGALVMGSRQHVPSNIRNLCQTEAFVLISLDYRLAPEVKVPDIIKDITDAFRWIHKNGRNLFYADTSRIVVAGGSAGGYLTMMTGLCIDPHPTALVAYYGYGDIDGHWYTQPS